MLRGPTRTQAFFQHRPHCIIGAYGYATSLSLLDEESMRELSTVLPAWFESVGREVDSAWEEYLRDWLLSHDGSRFPRWHEIEGRLNWILGMQNLPDYAHLIENYFKEHATWTQLDHVCAFVLRLQHHRILTEEGGVAGSRAAGPGAVLPPAAWAKATRWAAAYVMSEMLHWFQLEWQRDEVKQNRRGPRVAHIIDVLETKPHEKGSAYALHSQKPALIDWDFLRWVFLS